MSKLSDFFLILGKRKDFTEPEIKDVQTKIDVWLKLWLGIAKLEGFTNYIHMLCAGNIVHVLTKYESLSVLKLRVGISEQAGKSQHDRLCNNVCYMVNLAQFFCVGMFSRSAMYIITVHKWEVRKA
jgi:hypothetical protein